MEILRRIRKRKPKRMIDKLLRRDFVKQVNKNYKRYKLFNLISK